MQLERSSSTGGIGGHPEPMLLPAPTQQEGELPSHGEEYL